MPLGAYIVDALVGAITGAGIGFVAAYLVHIVVGGRHGGAS